MDTIISYLREHFLQDLGQFYQSQGRPFPYGSDFASQKMIDEFAKYLQSQQPQQEQSGFTSPTPDQQPPPNIVDEAPPPPPAEQPPSTFVETKEPSPGEQPPPSNTI